MSAAAQVTIPPSTAVRWYRLAVTVLGLALVAVSALTVYLAAHGPTMAPLPDNQSRTVAEEPCHQPRVPC
jgi:hypothetical protein